MRFRVAVALFATVSILSSLWALPTAAAQDQSLCTIDSTRQSEDASFEAEKFDWCFDGTTLHLKNRSDAVVRLEIGGDYSEYRRQKSGNVGEFAGSAIYVAMNDMMLPPNIGATMTVGKGKLTVRRFLDTDLTRNYAWLRFIAGAVGFVPGYGDVVDFWQALAGYTREIEDVIAEMRNCQAKSGFFGDIKCDAEFYLIDARVATQRFAINGTPVVNDVPKLVQIIWKGVKGGLLPLDMASIVPDAAMLKPGTLIIQASTQPPAASGASHAPMPPAVPRTTPIAPTSRQPDPPPSGTVLIDPCLDLHATPGHTGQVIGCVPKGVSLAVSCTVQSNSVTGPYGSSTVWDKVTYSGLTGYVADAWIYTGTNAASAASCAPAAPVATAPAQPPASYRTGRILISPCLDLHETVGHTGAVIGCVPKDATIPIICVTTSNSVTGPYGATTLWDRTTYNGQTGYVTDAWVYTGTATAVAPPC